MGLFFARLLAGLTLCGLFFCAIYVLEAFSRPFQKRLLMWGSCSYLSVRFPQANLKGNVFSFWSWYRAYSRYNCQQKVSNPQC